LLKLEQSENFIRPQCRLSDVDLCSSESPPTRHPDSTFLYRSHPVMYKTVQSRHRMERAEWRPQIVVCRSRSECIEYQLRRCTMERWKADSTGCD